MALINKSINEMTLKIVYYGPGLCGKTTNLQYIHKKANPQKRGKLLSIATESDRTLFFDLLPMEVGNVKGMKVRLQLYTVPGQVFYDATRKLVLKGADGVVFVADSQQATKDANIESVRNLQTNLKANRLDPMKIPLVLQFNKRDLQNLLTPEEMYNDVAYRDDLKYFPSCALTGKGVHETLKEIVTIVIKNIHKGVSHDLEPEEAAEKVAPRAVQTEEKKDELPRFAEPEGGVSEPAEEEVTLPGEEEPAPMPEAVHTAEESSDETAALHDVPLEEDVVAPEEEPDMAEIPGDDMEDLTSEPEEQGVEEFPAEPEGEENFEMEETPDKESSSHMPAPEIDADIFGGGEEESPAEESVDNEIVEVHELPADEFPNPEDIPEDAGAGAESDETPETAAESLKIDTAGILDTLNEIYENNKAHMKVLQDSINVVKEQQELIVSIMARLEKE